MKTLPRIVFTLLFVIIAVSGCDKNERDHLINTEEEIPKIKVSVHYVLNEKEFPDTYSVVYIFFEKKSENFIYWDYTVMVFFSLTLLRTFYQYHLFQPTFLHVHNKLFQRRFL